MTFAISVVSRAMAASAPPTLTEVDGFVAASDITITETLNRPMQLGFEILPSKQSSGILARFLDLTAQGTEIWVWDDSGTQIFAGPLLGYNPKSAGDDIAWKIRAFGLLDYLRRWRIEPDGADQIYTQKDQAVIAKGLIDYHQGLTYGDYGIDTDNVSLTTVLRDRTYLAIEGHLIAQRLEELAAVDDGFDYRIDPANREFLVDYPESGTDRTSTIIIDSRSIADPSAQISIGPEDIASEGFGIGDDGLVAHRTNFPLRAALGRSSFLASFSGITLQGTLDDHAQHLIDERSEQLHAPAKTLYPIGLAWEDFVLGDLVEFSYDYGAGTMTENRRILTRKLSIKGAVTKIGVGFA